MGTGSRCGCLEPAVPRRWQRGHGGGVPVVPIPATWVIARLEGVAAAKAAMFYVAPVGEKQQYVDRALANITPYLPGAS